MLWPSVLAWVYFVVLARPPDLNLPEPGSNPLVVFAYSIGKVLQFCFPVLYVWFMTGQLPRPSRPNGRSLIPGLGFGVLVAIATWMLYYIVLRDQPLFEGTPARVRTKMIEFGLDSPAAYVLFGVFLAVLHSLMEEYYWRWFIFGQLRRLLPFGSAAAVASLAFVAHHVINLTMFFPGKFLTMVVPLSLGVGIGGAVWAWLYEHSEALYSPWLSHVLIDAAILAVGYDMVFGG